MDRDKLTATFEIGGWDEQPIDDTPDERKITHAHVTKTFSGDVEGTSVLDYVMAYRPDGTAAFVGIERLTGVVGGRQGTLVLRHVGAFADGAATADVTVVEGCGSGALRGVTGTGDFRADPGGTLTLTLTGFGAS